MTVYRGRVWRFGDHVDTDQIIPAERLVSENLDCLGDFAFEKVRPGIAGKMHKGDIIIAERNFGCGSSREHAPLAIKTAGVSCVIAASFARIFYRNSINIGLPILECPEAAKGISSQDVVEVDFSTGVINNITTGKQWQAEPFPAFIQKMISSNGLIDYLRAEVLK